MLDKQAIIVGLLCLNMTPDLTALPEAQCQDFFQPSYLVQTDSVGYAPGGAVANIGLILHELGVPVRLIGKIGDDLFGHILQEQLRKIAPTLADDLVIDLSQPTGVTVLSNPPEGERSSFYHPGANNTFYASDLSREILERAHLFHFGGLSGMRSIYRGDGAELVSILARARRAGLSTSLGFELPGLSGPTAHLDGTAILENTLPLVDLFLPNVEALVFLLKREVYDQYAAEPQTGLIDVVAPEHLEEMANWVLARGVKALLVNLGKDGVYLRTASESIWQKCGRGLEHLDDRWHNRQIWAPGFVTTGTLSKTAGSAVHAGFLASVLQGAPPEQALRIAAGTSANWIETGSAIGTPGGWEHVGSQVESGWETLPLALAPFGWVEDRAQGLWTKPTIHHPAGKRR